jgi:hypothetical protein
VFSGPIEDRKVAVDALECTFEVFRDGYVTPYEEVEGSSTPERALAYFIRAVRPIAREGYEVLRQTPDRVVYSYALDGKVLAAVVIDNDQNPGTYLDGWGPGRYAWCDPAEFPAALDGNHDVQVWTDRAGNRVPTTRVKSYAGPLDCGMQSTTMLYLGGDEGPAYLRDPKGRIVHIRKHGKKPPALVRGPYRANAKLPRAARDSGFRRDGKALWLTPDAAYVVTDSQVEQWPRMTKAAVCL